MAWEDEQYAKLSHECIRCGFMHNHEEYVALRTLVRRLRDALEKILRPSYCSSYMDIVAEFRKIAADALTPLAAPGRATGCDCSEPNGHAKDCAIWTRELGRGTTNG